MFQSRADFARPRQIFPYQDAEPAPRAFFGVCENVEFERVGAAQCTGRHIDPRVSVRIAEHAEGRYFWVVESRLACTPYALVAEHAHREFRVQTVDPGKEQV